METNTKFHLVMTINPHDMTMTVAKGDAVGAGTGTGTERTETAGTIVVEAPETGKRRSKHIVFIPTYDTHWLL